MTVYEIETHLTTSSGLLKEAVSTVHRKVQTDSGAVSVLVGSRAATSHRPSRALDEAQRLGQLLADRDAEIERSRRTVTYEGVTRTPEQHRRERQKDALFVSLVLLVATLIMFGFVPDPGILGLGVVFQLYPLFMWAHA